MSGIINSAGSKSGIIRDGQDIYAHLKAADDAGAATSASPVEVSWDSQTGDTTNITRSGVNITLVKSGVYHLTCVWVISQQGGEERRYMFGEIKSVSGTHSTNELCFAGDSIVNAAYNPDYCGLTASGIFEFTGGDVVKAQYYGSDDIPYSEDAVGYATRMTIVRVFT